MEEVTELLVTSVVLTKPPAVHTIVGIALIVVVAVVVVVVVVAVVGLTLIGVIILALLLGAKIGVSASVLKLLLLGRGEERLRLEKG